jgi:hypothetical protein
VYEKKPEELAVHIAQAQEDVRGKGLCGAVYDDPEKGEVMCIRDTHTGQHSLAMQLPDLLPGKRKVLVGGSVLQDAQVTIREGVIYIEFDADDLDDIALDLTSP